jgi:hypothetical protein
MKNKISIPLMFIVFLSIVACQPLSDKNESQKGKDIFDEVAEIEAIMKVIEGETKCFFDGDYACWAKHWSHENYAMQAWNNSDGTADAAIGWEKINSQGKDWIEKYYKNGTNVIHPVVKREKPIVKFFNDKTAYLMWTQYNADKEKLNYRISQETRLMEKDKEGWKIVNVSAFWDTKSKIPFDSLDIH